MLSLASLLVALWLTGRVHDRFLEHRAFTPLRGAFLLGALIVGPLYALSTWLSLLTLPYVCILYITLPVDKKYAPSRRSQALSRLLPGPPAWVPYFGHAFLFFFKGPEKIINILEEACKEFPRLFSYKVFGSCWTLLRDPDDLELILGSMKHIEKGPEYSTLMFWLREGLLVSSGEKWKTRRKLFTPTFHFKILENNVESLNKNARLLLRKLLERRGEPLDVDGYIRSCTLDVIAETAMGISLDAQRNKNMDFINAIHKATEITVNRMINFLIYKDSIFKATPSGHLFKRVLNVLHGFSGKIIRDRKMSYMKGMKIDSIGGKKAKPFLDCLIELDLQNPNTLTDFDIREEVDTFMFEGHDTTSSALVFSLLLLGNHPQVQETAFREQLEIFEESDRFATTADLKAMTYLERVIKEVLRLYPPVPIMSRFIGEDLTLAGNIVLPGRSTVLFSPYLTHRDPKHFPEPELFDPDRFSPENCQTRHPFAYLPFSAGPRNCIGQKFASMELKTILSTLLRFSRIEAITKVEDVEPVPHLIIKPNRPVVIRVYPRFMKGKQD